MGVEPIRPNGHMALNHACLPIPAPGRSCFFGRTNIGKYFHFYNGNSNINIGATYTSERSDCVCACQTLRRGQVRTCPTYGFIRPDSSSLSIMYSVILNTSVLLVRKLFTKFEIEVLKSLWCSTASSILWP